MAKRRTFARRPNNSGTVVKLSGNRRNPYAARITEGKDILTGQAKQKCIGYFETREEALDALTIYRLAKDKDYDDRKLAELGGHIYEEVSKLRDSDIPTFEDIYKILLETDYSELTKSRKGAIESAFKSFDMIRNMKINRITLNDLQTCVDAKKDDVKEKSLQDMKAVASRIFKYAVIHQHIKRENNYCEYINTSTKNKTNEGKHINFSFDEINRIKNDHDIVAKTILVYIMTGCRPTELCELEKKNIHLDEDCDDNGEHYKVSYFITGSKTESGRNRIIPIHDSIKGIFMDVYDFITEYNTETYRKRHFEEYMKKTKMKHTPYDTRHTFATICKLNRLDDFCVQRIMGHKTGSLKDRVYTHEFINELYKEINKISI